MSNLFSQLHTIESDEDKLRRIQELQDAFSSVKASYQHEHDDNLRQALDTIKTKIKRNSGMVHAVNKFSEDYIPQDRRERGKEELYDLLAAEMLQTMSALQHTECVIL